MKEARNRNSLLKYSPIKNKIKQTRPYQPKTTRVNKT